MDGPEELNPVFGLTAEIHSVLSQIERRAKPYMTPEPAETVSAKDTTRTNSSSPVINELEGVMRHARAILNRF